MRKTLGRRQVMAAAERLPVMKAAVAGVSPVKSGETPAGGERGGEAGLRRRRLGPVRGHDGLRGPVARRREKGRRW